MVWDGRGPALKEQSEIPRGLLDLKSPSHGSAEWRTFSRHSVSFSHTSGAQSGPPGGWVPPPSPERRSHGPLRRLHPNSPVKRGCCVFCVMSGCLHAYLPY